MFSIVRDRFQFGKSRNVSEADLSLNNKLISYLSKLIVIYKYKNLNL